MNSLNALSLAGAVLFLLAPSVALAQVPDSQSPKSQYQAEKRTAEIESARSDIADLSKFENDHEKLPKSIYKRNYVDKHEPAAMIAGHSRANDGTEHHI